MKKINLFLVLLFTNQVYAQQIKLPKIPNPFKKDIGKAFHVKWSCPQEDYKNIAQLAPEADVEVYINKKGEVSYRPNVFKVRPLSKEFVQGLNPLNLVKKKATYKVDYSECINRFYQEMNKEHQAFKKNCESDSSEICAVDSNDLVAKARKATEESRYMALQANTILLPKSLPGTIAISLSSEEALEQLGDFCNTGIIKSKEQLLSNSVVSEIKKKSASYFSGFPGLECIKRYSNLFKTEVEGLSKEHCSEGQATPVCNKSNELLVTAEASLKEATDKISVVVEREQKLFEYRYGALGDEAAVDQHLKNNFKIPEGNCQFGNNEIVDNKRIDISRFDQQISDNIESIFSEGSSECQRQFLQNYLTAKLQSGVDDEKFVEYCKLHETEYCKRIQGNQALVTRNLEKMLAKVYGGVGERFFNEEIACHIEDNSSITDILNKVKDNEKAFRCTDLKPGEFKNVSWRQNQDVGTGEYSLKKVGDNKYEAYLNIEFSSNNGAKTTGEEMMKRAQACMGVVSPYFKGPNGEELTIKIVNSENDLNSLPLNQRPTKVNIGIAGVGFRSHSKMYEENIDCPVITHEVLHLFGLCDEYKEQWKGEGQNFDCRVVPTGPSVMKDQHEMFELAVDKTITCDCSSSLCQSMMKSNDPEKIKFYLGNSVYDMTDYKGRSKYCKYGDLPNRKYSDLKEDRDKAVIITSESEGKLEIESRGIDEDRPGQIYRSKITCSCNPSDEMCANFLAESKQSIESSADNMQTNCPNGASTKSRDFGRKGDAPYSFDESNKTLIVNKKAKEPSLLYPSHFERIIGGACEDNAKIYIECSKFAYSNGPCKVPDYCKDNSKYLGNKQ